MSDSTDSVPVADASTAGGAVAAETEATSSASTSTAAMDAKARREARKARILGSGTDRLARITKTGRGQEAETLYSDAPKPLGGQQQQSHPAQAEDVDEDSVLSRADAALADDGTDDPHDVDISQMHRAPNASADPFLAALQQQQQRQGMAGGQGGFGMQQEEMPQDLQGMMKALQGMMGGGAGGPDQPGGPFAQMPQMQAQAPGPQQKSSVDVIFNLLRMAIFAIFGFALVYGAVRSGHAEAEHAVVEKAAAATIDRFEHMSTLHRWARLAYERPAHWEARYFSMESFGLPVQGVSVFWLFITLEVGLASMRIMLQRSRPPPPSFLLKVANFIPHAGAQLLLRTIASYLPLLDAFLNDVAIVVFSLGCAIMYAAWKVGLDPLLAPTDGAAADVAGNVVDAVAAAATSTIAAPPL